MKPIIFLDHFLRCSGRCNKSGRGRDEYSDTFYAFAMYYNYRVLTTGWCMKLNEQGSKLSLPLCHVSGTAMDRGVCFQ